jgi:hypothetical protein
MNPCFDFKCVVGVSVIVFDFNYIKKEIKIFKWIIERLFYKIKKKKKRSREWDASG